MRETLGGFALALSAFFVTLAPIALLFVVFGSGAEALYGMVVLALTAVWVTGGLLLR